MNKARVYTWIKVGGLLSLLPLVLASGPLAGYIVGYYLIKLLNFPHYTAILCAIIGFIAGALETVKILRATLKAGEGE